MSYELVFLPSALDEWRGLDNSVRQQLKKVLLKRLTNPHVPSAALHGMANCYKIKLRRIGYRLIYQVDDGVVTVTVIAIGRREHNQAYDSAHYRLNET